MVYGRYNELVSGGYKPTFTSLGGTILVLVVSGKIIPLNMSDKKMG